MSCPYKDALGVPGEGFHSMRFMGVAVGDTVGTILLAAFIARIFNFKFVPTLLVLFFVGELLHWYFCVDSTVMKWVAKAMGGQDPGAYGHLSSKIASRA